MYEKMADQMKISHEGGVQCELICDKSCSVSDCKLIGVCVCVSKSRPTERRIRSKPILSVSDSGGAEGAEI